MKIKCLLLTLFLLAGCASKPAPAWLATSHKHIETYKRDFLSAHDPAVAELRFKRAVTEIKSAGDLNLLGKAILTRMALRIAVLEAADGDEYITIEKAQPSPVNRNFYIFLKGDMTQVNGSLLPSQYRSFLTALQSGDAVRTGKTIAAIEEPLSLLIASGLAVVNKLENEAILLTAVDAASHKGWKKALMVWLKRLANYYETVGDKVKAEGVNRRIAIVEK